MYLALYLVLCVCTLLWTAAGQTNIQCPKNCDCSASGQKLRLKCGTAANKIVSIKEIDFGEIEADVEQLDLSKNQIIYIEPDVFLNMTSLKKLDLTSNLLKQIDEATFGELASLERLKLSSNMIAHIFQGAFEKMKNLKQIDISSNPLACDCDLLWLIPWSEQQSIKLQPAPKCATPIPFKGKQVKNLKIGTDLHCESPLTPLLELRPSVDQLLFEGDQLTLRCRAPRLAVPNLSIRDSEDLNAEDLPVAAKSHVFWGWADQVLEPGSMENITYYDPQIRFPSVTVDNRHLADSGLLDSVLRIPFVRVNHSGTWDCRLLSADQMSRSIKVIIISDKTKYCSVTQTQTNRGTYYWPKTIRNNVVKLPCAGDGAANSLVASYRCNDQGNWDQLDLSACPFIRESTRILEQFSKVNLTLARGSVLQSAKRLRNYTFFDYTEMLPKFRDPIDVTFIAKTLKNFLEFLNTEAELGGILLDIISQTMQLPPSLLQKAQQLDSACSSFLEIAETITSHASTGVTNVSQKPNLALESFRIRPDSFSGLTCVWFKTNFTADNQHTESRILQCNDGNKPNLGNGFNGLNERFIDVSIQLPSTLFPQLLASQPVAAQPQQLLVSVYENSNFFPQQQQQQQQYRITSPIIGVKVTPPSAANNKNHGNLTDPIFIVLRFQPFHNELSLPKPVWWDAQQSGGGAWTTQNCHPTHFLQFGMLVFACNKLGYYGLIQHKKYLNDFADETAGARFRLSPRGIYAGGFILFLCLWVQIITFICYGRQSIQMGHRIRHALINTWLALSLLVLVLTVGIQQTEDSHVCQIFGILIHYLSLSVLLWLCVSLTQMYKRVSRRERISSSSLPPSEVIAMATAEHPRERKPIMGLYFVGWGIGLLVCGISGAVNLREYASYNYCFVTVGPAMGAVLVPALILIGFLAILYICIRFHLRNREVMIHLSSDGGTTQATENVDLELLDANAASDLQATALQPQQTRSISTSIPASASSSSSYYDSETSVRRQLQAYVNVLLLYIVTWLAAGVTITNPFVDHLMYAEDIFGAAYAVLATILGLYIVYFYGMARADVRNVWSGIGCWRKKKFHNYPLMMGKLGPSNGHGGGEINGGAATSTYYATAPQMISRSNSQSSSKNHHHRGGGADLNSLMRRNESPNRPKIGQNMNLLHLHRQQFVHNQVVIQQPSIPEGSCATTNPDLFYNPNQSNVARKFFKRQKRLQKQNNIDFVQRHHHPASLTTDCDASSISSLFGSCGSKVNNTNIHVGRNIENGGYSKEMRTNFFNPNILSDSCNESDLLMDTVVQDGLRFTTSFQKNSNSLFPFGNGMVTPSVGSSVADSLIANIYTNIPETGVPQHEIVTMRAEEKFSNMSELRRGEEEDTHRNELSDELVSSVTSAATTVENAPHYINTMEAHRVLAANDNDSTTASMTTCLELKASPTRSGTDGESSTNLDSVVMSLSSPLNSAMNTVGLPLDLSPTTANCDQLHRKAYECDKHDDLILKLDKDEAYISSPLEISAGLELSRKVFRSKSLDMDARDAFSQSLYYPESQTKSISCNNVSLFDDNSGLFGRGATGQHQPPHHTSSSPVLFSPSLCDINDDDEGAMNPNSSMTTHRLDDTASVGSGQNLLYLNPDNTPNFSNIFNTSTLSSAQRHQLPRSSSPTAYSDINYQNSEISIRSQDFYAPQPDNMLNIILAAQCHFNFEISDIEDENDLDEAYSRDYLRCPQDEEASVEGATTDGTSVDQDEDEDVDLLNESQSSIDELYQQIKRNDQAGTQNGELFAAKFRCAVDDEEEGSSQTNEFDEDDERTRLYE